MKTTTKIMVCHKFHKRCTLILKLKKSRKFFDFGPSMFFQFNIYVKIYFCYFFIPGLGRRERGHWILVVERETRDWHWFKPSKWMIFVSNCSFWWGGFMLGVFFFTFKVCKKKHIWVQVKFWFEVDFVFLSSFFSGFLKSWIR